MKSVTILALGLLCTALVLGADRTSSTPPPPPVCDKPVAATDDASAPDVQTLVLRVVDETGAGIANASVSLMCVGFAQEFGSLVSQAKTDAQGVFTGEIVQGVLKVYVEATGYYTENADLGAGTSANIRRETITLKRRAQKSE